MSKLGNKLVIVGAILIVIGLCVFGYDIYMNKSIGDKSEEAFAQIKEIIDDNINNNDIKEDNELEVSIDNNKFVGIISLPSIQKYLPIQSCWDYKKLKVSPCIYYGSIEKNNLVICAHGYKSQFGDLTKMIVNDKVIITDLNGENYEYVVVDVELIEPTSVEKVLETDYDLTLFCCYNGVAKRVLVHCNRI